MRILELHTKTICLLKHIIHQTKKKLVSVIVIVTTKTKLVNLFPAISPAIVITKRKKSSETKRKNWEKTYSLQGRQVHLE